MNYLLRQEKKELQQLVKDTLQKIERDSLNEKEKFSKSLEFSKTYKDALESQFTPAALGPEYFEEIETAKRMIEIFTIGLYSATWKEETEMVKKFIVNKSDMHKKCIEINEKYIKLIAEMNCKEKVALELIIKLKIATDQHNNSYINSMFYNFLTHPYTIIGVLGFVYWYFSK